MRAKRYYVKETVSYPDPMLGTFVIEKGDVLEQCIDNPNYYSNGLAMVTIHNILHRVPQYFEPIKEIKKGLKVIIIKKDTYSEEQKKIFLKHFEKLAHKTHAYLLMNGDPILVSIGGKFPRKMKKKFKKLNLI